MILLILQVCDGLLQGLAKRCVGQGMAQILQPTTVCLQLILLVLKVCDGRMHCLTMRYVGQYTVKFSQDINVCWQLIVLDIFSDVHSQNLHKVRTSVCNENSTAAHIGLTVLLYRNRVCNSLLQDSQRGDAHIGTVRQILCIKEKCTRDGIETCKTVAKMRCVFI